MERVTFQVHTDCRRCGEKEKLTAVIDNKRDMMYYKEYKSIPPAMRDLLCPCKREPGIIEEIHRRLMNQPRNLQNIKIAASALDWCCRTPDRYIPNRHHAFRMGAYLYSRSPFFAGWAVSVDIAIKIWSSILRNLSEIANAMRQKEWSEDDERRTVYLMELLWAYTIVVTEPILEAEQSLHQMAKANPTILEHIPTVENLARVQLTDPSLIIYKTNDAIDETLGFSERRIERWRMALSRVRP